MRVIDPVAQVLVQPREVVRHEAWETVAVPPRPRALRKLVSAGSLARAR